MFLFKSKERKLQERLMICEAQLAVVVELFRFSQQERDELDARLLVLELNLDRAVAGDSKQPLSSGTPRAN